MLYCKGAAACFIPNPFGSTHIHTHTHKHTAAVHTHHVANQHRLEKVITLPCGAMHVTLRSVTLESVQSAPLEDGVKMCG